MGGCCSGKTSLFVITLIISVVHLSIALNVILIYNCIEILDLKDALQFSLYATYFNNRECKVNSLLPASTEPSERTFDLAIAMLSLDILWIIACIVVLIFAKNPDNEKRLLGGYIFWDVIASAEIVCDIVAIALFAKDITEEVGARFVTEEIPVQIPSVIMVILSSRFVVFFLFNLATYILMLITTNRMRKELGSPKKRIIPLKPPKPAIKTPKVPHLEEDNIPRVNDWYKHYEGVETKVDDTNAPRSQYRTPPVPPVNYQPPGVEDVDAGHPVMPGAHTNVLVNGVTSGTLRRQLPWSYMPDPGVLPRRQPRKPAPPPPPKPYMPPPDYPLQAPRPNSRQVLTEPGWAQYPPSGTSSRGPSPQYGQRY